MQILYATEPSPGQANEDFVITGPTWAVVLDGATISHDVDTGCLHTVSWFVCHLGTELARLLTTEPEHPLDDSLAAAITTTRRLHEDTCDLSNPDSPSATVVAARASNGRFDYLTLADSPLVVDADGDVHAITDDRTAHLSDYSVEGVRNARNSPGGFYVAATAPEAAYQAVRGSLPITSLRHAALLTDGATRLVDRFELLDWQQLLELLVTQGPQELIRRTRQVERRETDAEQSARRGKQHDDATAVLITHLAQP